MAHQHDAIEAILKRHHSFEECLLEEVRLSRFGTTLALEFAYIWSDDEADSVRASTTRRITIDCELVHEVQIVTALPPSILAEPERADWGLTEVALVRLQHDSELLEKHHGASIPLHHLLVEWEGDRRIDVIFGLLRVRDGGESMPPVTALRGR